MERKKKKRITRGVSKGCARWLANIHRGDKLASQQSLLLLRPDGVPSRCPWSRVSGTIDYRHRPAETTAGTRVRLTVG